MGITEEAGKVATTAVQSMQGAPLAIALLLVNIGFLGFAAYILGEVSSNAAERNKTQMDLIVKLVGDISNCRQGAKPMDWKIGYPPSNLEIVAPQ